jgi:hypothetical protein
MPLVSIVMPARNAQDTIEEAIQSVQSQNLRDWELLVIDDASTDETSDIVSRLSTGDSRIRQLAGERKGVSHSRNLGIEESTGECICFLDSDDILGCNALSGRYDMLSDGKRQISYCRTILVNQVLRPLGYVIDGRKDLSFADFYWNPVHTSGVMFQRTILKNLRFDEKLSNGEDWLMWARLARMGYTFFRSYRGYSFYRIHPNSTVSRDYLKHYQGVIKVISTLFGQDQGCPEPDDRYKFGLNSETMKPVIQSSTVSAILWSVLGGRKEDVELLGREINGIRGAITFCRQVLSHLTFTVSRFYGMPKQEFSSVFRYHAPDGLSLLRSINRSRVSTRILKFIFSLGRRICGIKLLRTMQQIDRIATSIQNRVNAIFPNQISK